MRIFSQFKEFFYAKFICHSRISTYVFDEIFY